MWIYNAEFFSFRSHIYIFAVGLLFGFVYKKTGSLCSVVILHTFHIFIVTIF
ncbi:CPBP family intramembrane metalloprotease [Bacillaceae bacterium Marseille-Q3522]|nr:CPBP family intramembrane metalloprotease [Bacillaceae bacterium Marseille-Q3522]